MTCRVHIRCFVVLLTLATVVSCKSTKKKDPVDAFVRELLKPGEQSISQPVQLRTAIAQLEPEQTEPQQTPPPEQQQQMVRRSHLRINNDETEARFLDLVRGKNKALEDIGVMKRMVLEKKAEIAKFAMELTEKYKLEPDKNYHYDQLTMTIQELIPAESDAPKRQDLLSGPPQPKMKAHMKLKTRDEGADFIRLTSSKRLSAEQLRTLEMIVREKEIEISEYERLLLSEFAISRDRQYHYETDTKMLYELVPVPEGTESP